MPRPKELNPRIVFTFRLAQDLAGRLELESYDPRFVSHSGKMPYNIKGSILDAAMREYFHKLTNQRREDNPHMEYEKMDIDTTVAAESLSPQERSALILKLRGRVLAGEELGSDLIKYSLSLVRADREARTGIIPKKKAAKLQKEASLHSDVLEGF